MTYAVHKGLIVELQKELRLAGIQIDANAASQLLVGYSYFSSGSYADRISKSTANALFSDRHTHMKNWEEAHPGEKPFPDPFPAVVLQLLRMSEDIDLNSPTITQIIKLAESELSP